MVSLRRTRQPRIVARFNGDQLTTEAVSIEVARRYCELDGRSWNTEISHQSAVQSGLGYGTSGSGALSLSLALNEAMGLSLSMPEAAQIAHLCEVECKTGLGTVASVFSGGLTVTSAPGATELAQLRKLNLPSSLRVSHASIGPIWTRRAPA